MSDQTEYIESLRKKLAAAEARAIRYEGALKTISSFVTKKGDPHPWENIAHHARKVAYESLYAEAPAPAKPAGDGWCSDCGHAWGFHLGQCTMDHCPCKGWLEAISQTEPAPLDALRERLASAIHQWQWDTSEGADRNFADALIEVLESAVARNDPTR